MKQRLSTINMLTAITNVVKPSGFGCPILSVVLLYVGRLVLQVDSLWLTRAWGKGLISKHQLMAPPGLAPLQGS